MKYLLGLFFKVVKMAFDSYIDFMKKAMLFYLFLFFCSCAPFQTQPEDCVDTRGAWDFGSGTIKVKVARVNLCTKEILKVLYNKNKAIGFKQDLLLQKNRKFSKAVKSRAKAFVESVLRQTQKIRISKNYGVATAAFRESENAKKFLNELEKKYGLEIKIISQDKEAYLGVLSASTKVELKKPNYIVWDIGGGSQQITWVKKKKTKSFKSQWAAVSFKNWIINNIKKNKTLKSPNPLRKKEFYQAIAKAKEFSRSFKMPSLSEIESEKIGVIGIGGVHASSLKPRLKKETYSRKDLYNLGAKYLKLEDSEIGGPYASTEVSNIALVLGTMQGLNIKKVRALKVGLLEGLLISRNESLKPLK